MTWDWTPVSGTIGSHSNLHYLYKNISLISLIRIEIFVSVRDGGCGYTRRSRVDYYIDPFFLAMFCFHIQSSTRYFFCFSVEQGHYPSLGTYWHSPWLCDWPLLCRGMLELLPTAAGGAQHSWPSTHIYQPLCSGRIWHKVNL